MAFARLQRMITGKGTDRLTCACHIHSQPTASQFTDKTTKVHRGPCLFASDTENDPRGEREGRGKQPAHPEQSHQQQLLGGSATLCSTRQLLHAHTPTNQPYTCCRGGVLNASVRSVRSRSSTRDLSDSATMPVASIASRLCSRAHMCAVLTGPAQPVGLQ